MGDCVPGQRGQRYPRNLTKMSLNGHNGMHMDAPCHFVAEGCTMEPMPLEAVVGPCRVIPVKHRSQIAVD